MSLYLYKKFQSGEALPLNRPPYYFYILPLWKDDTSPPPPPTHLDETGAATTCMDSLPELASVLIKQASIRLWNKALTCEDI